MMIILMFFEITLHLFSENRKCDKETTRTDDEHKLSPESNLIINQSCHSKRDTSQILALFTGNSVSKSEEKSDDFDVLQVCPLSPEIYFSDDPSHDDISNNSHASPACFHSLPAVLNKPYSNPLVVCENSCNDIPFDTGDNLFQVPDVDTKDHKRESSPYSINITCIRESTVGSRKEYQKVCLPCFRDKKIMRNIN